MGHKKPTATTIFRFVLYGIVLVVAFLLQTTPVIVSKIVIWPIYCIPACLLVALYEGEFAGALFGLAGGLLWDVASGRIAGFFSLQLMLLCFMAAILWKLYLQNTFFNFILIVSASTAIMLTIDFIVNYFLRHYPSLGKQYILFILPQVLITALAGGAVYWLGKKIIKFTTETKGKNK